MATRTKKSTIDPTEKTTKADNVAPQTKDTGAQQADGQNDKQSQLATILVGLLIIASGLLIYNYFQRSNTPDTTSQNQQQQENQDKQADNDNENKDEDSKGGSDNKEGQYTVVAGDSLWSIAEKVYGNGFDWTKIRDANQLGLNANGDPAVEIGQVLNLPDSAAVVQQPSTDKDVIANNTESDVAGVQELREIPATAVQTYTVQQGDTLWSIAETVYGDGEQWVMIMQDSHNQIGQLPDGRPLVHAGNVLYIPELP